MRRGSNAARRHRNRVVPKSACEKGDFGTKTELSHGIAVEMDGWLRLIVLANGKTSGQRTSRVELAFYVPFI